MDPLPPIPVPLRQRWSDFRVGYLPVLTFLLLVVTIAWMWSRYIHPANIVGEVETLHANVISILPGTVQVLNVDRFQPVTNGQELALVSLGNPDLLRSELAAVEADLRVLKARTDVDKTRNVDAHTRLRVSLLTERIALDVARIRLQQAEGEFQRVHQLYTNNIIGRGIGLSPRTFATQNDFGYDVAVRDRDMLQAEVEARAGVVTQIEQDLKQLEATGVVQVSPIDPVIEEAIRAQQERLRQLNKGVVLKSPIDGFVSLVNHRPGEKVTAGLPILVISGSKSDQIIGWVRQPVRVLPAVGDVVQVRLNRAGQHTVEAVITAVAGQLEPVSVAALPPMTPPNHVELGLQFRAKAPEDADLLRGEAVEMSLKTSIHRKAVN